MAVEHLARGTPNRGTRMAAVEAAVKERPILFSAPMVRAILAGSKTVTRRLVRLSGPSDSWHLGALDRGLATFRHVGNPAMGAERRCPYGRPGERLWVKETWQPLWAKPDEPPASLAEPGGWKLGYVATDGVQEYHDEDAGLVHRCKPAIFMRRWMSRITLEVTNVRTERLHAITEQDAILEGIGEIGFPRETFASLWDQINSKRAPWSANPWVWRIGFAGACYTPALERGIK